MPSTRVWARPKRIKKSTLDENFEYFLPGRKTSKAGLSTKKSQVQRKPVKKRHAPPAKEVCHERKFKAVHRNARPRVQKTSAVRSVASACSPCSAQPSALERKQISRGQCLLNLPRPLTDEDFWQPLVLLSTCGCKHCNTARDASRSSSRIAVAERERDDGSVVRNSVFMREHENDSPPEGGRPVPALPGTFHNQLRRSQFQCEKQRNSPSRESGSSSDFPDSESSSCDSLSSLSDLSDPECIPPTQVYASVSNSPRFTLKKRAFEKKHYFSRTTEPPESSVSESDLPPAELKKNSYSKIVNQPGKLASVPENCTLASSSSTSISYSSPRNLKKKGSNPKEGEDSIQMEGGGRSAKVSSRGRPKTGRENNLVIHSRGEQRRVGNKQFDLRSSLQKENVRMGGTNETVKSSGSSHIPSSTVDASGSGEKFSSDPEEFENGTNDLQTLIRAPGTAQASLSKNGLNDLGGVQEVKADTVTDCCGTSPKKAGMMTRGKNTVKEASAPALRRLRTVVTNDGEMLSPCVGKVDAVAADEQPGSCKKARISARSYNTLMKQCSSAVVVLDRVKCNDAGKKRAVNVGKDKGPALCEEGLETSPKINRKMVICRASGSAPCPLDSVMSGVSGEESSVDVGEVKGHEGGGKCSVVFSKKGHISKCERGKFLKPGASVVSSQCSYGDRGVSLASDAGAIEDSAGSSIPRESCPKMAELRVSRRAPLDSTSMMEGTSTCAHVHDSTEMIVDDGGEGRKQKAGGSQSSHVSNSVFSDDASDARQYEDGTNDGEQPGRGGVKAAVTTASFRQIPLHRVASGGANGGEMRGNLYTEESCERSKRLKLKYFTCESKSLIRSSASPLVSLSGCRSNDPEELASDIRKNVDSACVQNGAVCKKVSVVEVGPSSTSRRGDSAVIGLREGSSNDTVEMSFQNVEDEFESLSSEKEEIGQTVKENQNSTVGECDTKTIDVPEEKSDDDTNVRDVSVSSSVLSCGNSRLEKLGHSSGHTGCENEDEYILGVEEDPLNVDEDFFDVEGDLENADTQDNGSKESTSWSSMKVASLLERAENVIDIAVAFDAEIEKLKNILKSKDIEIFLLKRKLSNCKCNM